MDEAHITTGLRARGLDCQRLAALLLMLCLSAVSWYARPSESASLLILLSQASPPYEHLSGLVEAGLAKNNLVVETRTVAEVDATPTAHSPDLILAIGTHAGRYAIDHWPRAAILTSLVPRRAFAEISAASRQRIEQGRLSAIYLDQPLERQLRFIGALLPEARSVGVLYGKNSIEQNRELERLSHEAGLAFHGLDGRQARLPRTIRRLALLSDVILALPDPSVMTPNHAKWLLYIAYRHRTPVVAYSQRYVEAGALAAIYTSPEQIARQASAVIRRFFEAPPGRRRLQTPTFPSDFSIATNRHVAHSLGLELPATGTVRRRILNGEHAPTGARP